SCEKLLINSPLNNEASGIIDELWQQIDNNYLSFDENKIGWPEVRKKYLDLAGEVKTDDDLFKLCRDLLFELKDPTLTLLVDNQRFAQYYDPSWKINFNIRNIEREYINPNKPIFISPSFRYCVLGSNNIGYVPLTASGNERITDSQIAEMFENLKETKGIIFDLRGEQNHNSDRNANLYVRLINNPIDNGFIGFFEGKGKLKIIKSVNDGPRNPYYKGKIFLLTGNVSTLSKNRFLLSVKELPNATSIGDTSFKGKSGRLIELMLSNGWKLYITHSFFMDNEKNSHFFGIKPDIPLPNTFKNGKDDLIEKAIELIK
ncbi:MAG TPA: S41 family peptidase, partial [Saprospiraceae bacterium]|nr:S41 family peptidase [Saprospiraceae bacterium]